jgi:hypothetical protein
MFAANIRLSKFLIMKRIMNSSEGGLSSQYEASLPRVYFTNFAGIKCVGNKYGDYKDGRGKQSA